MLTALQAFLHIVVILGIVIGFSFSLWAAIGLLRFLTDWTGLVPNEPRSARRHPTRMWKPGEPLHLAGRGEHDPEHRVTLSDVAVIIPARNEEGALPRCIASLSKVIPIRQVYVASDGSTDRTVEVARSLGCQVSDIRPNGGKAKALQHVINEHALCRNYKAVLILDADSEADEHYFRYALPLFDDPNVVTIAGHQLSTWRPDWFPSFKTVMRIISFRASRQDVVNAISGLRKLFFTAYRVRLFRAMQSVYQYGQSWRPLSVTYIAPGAASMYRTSALPSIDIAAPNLVIEDFNMTFEVQHKRLGRIAYSPHAQCTSEDPFTFRDYCKQIRRWYLGFWQTVRRHGFWPSLFSLSLALFAVEVLAFSVFLAVLPLLVLLWLVTGTEAYTLSAAPFGIIAVSPLTLLLTYFAIDLLTTFIVAAYEKRPELILFAPLFPFLRYVDAVVYLRSFVGSFQTRSDGKWSSPTRQLPMQAAPPAPGS